MVVSLSVVNFLGIPQSTDVMEDIRLSEILRGNAKTMERGLVSDQFADVRDRFLSNFHNSLFLSSKVV